MADQAEDFSETGSILDPEPLDLEDDFEDITPECSKAKKPGRKKNAVWNYFIEDETRKAGHSSSTCVYCGDIWIRGRVPDMMAHLALQCESVEPSVKEQYLRILSENTQFLKGQISLLNLRHKKSRFTDLAHSWITNAYKKLQENNIVSNNILETPFNFIKDKFESKVPRHTTIISLLRIRKHHSVTVLRVFLTCISSYEQKFIMKLHLDQKFRSSKDIY
jgi:hypothetical protein